MRTELLGLALDDAKALLLKEGICPQVRVTSAPRRENGAEGTLRVVYASDDGRSLTVASFLSPLFK